MNSIRPSARTPRVAVLLDENTSGNGRRHELGKGCFEAIQRAGGSAYGIPYAPGMVAEVVAGFDGLLTPGGRFASPADWYLGEAPDNPASDRAPVDRALVSGFVAAGKPVLGICAGMQTLAGLAGCRFKSGLDVEAHDGADVVHPVTVVPGTRLHGLVCRPRMIVNSLHREAVATLGKGVRASAHAPDGVIEAIELTDHPFAIGLQWHQELFAGTDHPGARVFEGFVAACFGRRPPTEGGRVIHVGYPPISTTRAPA